MAAAASQERDAVATRVCAALGHAALKRMAATEALEEDNTHSIVTDISAPDGDGDLHDALLHEAAAVLNLHSQAVAV